MGGRGTFASGNSVPYKYETVGKLYNIKVLKGINGTHGLPEESHKSSAYVYLNPNGTARQLRVYDENHTAKVDIELSAHRGKIILHAHDYVNGVRQLGRPLKKEEIDKYRKYFGGRNDKQ